MTSRDLPQGQDYMTEDFITNWLKTGSFPFRSVWLALYALAQGQADSDPTASRTHDLTLIYGAFLYSGNASLEQLLNLHNIEVSSNFPTPLKSLTGSSYMPFDDEYKRSLVKQVLLKDATPYPQKYFFYDESLTEKYQEYKIAKLQHEHEMDRQSEACAATLLQFWPAEWITTSDLNSCISQHSLLNYNIMLESSITCMMRKWYNNRNLKMFIGEVERRMSEATGDCYYQLSNAKPAIQIILTGAPFSSDGWLVSEDLLGSTCPDPCWSCYQKNQLDQ